MNNISKAQLNVLIFLFAIVAVFVLGVTLLSLGSVLLPFVIAVLISIIFDPLVAYLKSKKSPDFLLPFDCFLYLHDCYFSHWTYSIFKRVKCV